MIIPKNNERDDYYFMEKRLRTNFNSQRKKSNIGLILLIYIAFISLGLPDGLLGVAWPDMRSSFGLPLDALGIITIAFTSGYLISSFFNGVLIKKMGVAGLLATSCFATGLALVGYTLVPVWWLLPILAVLAGLGAGAIDAGLNTYVEENYGESLMQWLHASFGIGVTLGPIIMSTGLSLTGTWRTGYIVVGVAQLLLAATFLLTISMWEKQERNKESKSKRKSGNKMSSKVSLTQTLKHLPAWLSIGLFFIYTGIELSVGHWSYTLFTESRCISPELAGLWVGGYWGSFTVGRILAGFLSFRIKSKKLVELGGLLALGGSLLLCLNIEHWFYLLGIVLIGIAIAPIFPALVSSTSDRVGKEHTSNTIGMQIAAAGLGGALLPGLAGVLAQNISLEVIPIFIVCLFLMFLLLHRVILYIKMSTTNN
ncbi:MFS transporter [Halothermothrix orenii]|uniref:Major facilitator superfamily MFS_1 n=1 Tax=Halothermothrix orenii (strain H 168 / OCM 544 / DSM 9562) TaxID=373903 RepID=B8CXS5_HALOH|nr:MFS transporter [Halothermothrix orenii]ACL70094.1 major facilitator superfamily MFS_1 [Halothermothrix orenii H 168]